MSSGKVTRSTSISTEDKRGLITKDKPIFTKMKPYNAQNQQHNEKLLFPCILSQRSFHSLAIPTEFHGRMLHP